MKFGEIRIYGMTKMIDSFLGNTLIKGLETELNEQNKALIILK